MPPPGPDGFSYTLSEAIEHFAEFGYQSSDDLEWWLTKLRMAAERDLPLEQETLEQLRESLGALYRRLERGSIAKFVPGVKPYTIDQVRSSSRAELDRRILASADLIKLNRKAAVEKTLQRFSGWSTSIPAGGDTRIDKRDAKSDIGKSMAQVKYEARRVAIDQGHKLTANVADIVARGNGAIAAIWHSHWRQAGYNYRKDHKERDGHVYLIRDSWAQEGGFVKPGAAGYLDDITQPAQETFCRCYAQYLATLNKMPDDMLTEKGRQAIAAAKEMRKAA